MMHALAIELIHHIAYFATTSSSYTPHPASILSNLHLISKRWHSALDPIRHPHFYARLFRSQFDFAALYRRFPSLHASALQHELFRRWNVLKRIRYMTSNNVWTDHWKPRKYRREILLEDLMTMYLMLIENDGRNVEVLKTFGNVEVWLERWRWWRVNKLHENPTMPPDSEEMALYWWIEWLFMDQGKCLAESEGTRRSMTWLLIPYALGTFKYPLTYAPWPYHQLPLAQQSPSPSSPSTTTPQWTLPTPSTSSDTHLSPLHITSHTLTPRPLSSSLPNNTYLGRPFQISSPLLHHATTMMFLARKQMDQGSNVSTYIDFPLDLDEGREGSLSRKWDLEWRRLKECRDPLASVADDAGGLTTKRGMHVAGSLTGEWDGWFSIISPANFETLMTSSDSPSSPPSTPRPLNVLEDAWLLQDVQAWHIEEHHLRLDALLHSSPPPASPGAMGMMGMETGHPLNAHVPVDLEVVKKNARVWSVSDARWMDGLIVRRRVRGGKELFYETIRPGTPKQSFSTSTSISPNALDILITGNAILSPSPLLPPSTPTSSSSTYTSNQSRFMPHPTATLLGTIRSWDGLITLRAKAGDSIIGDFIWNGYLSGGGSWGGRWRDASVDVGRTGWEGVFAMKQRRD